MAYVFLSGMTAEAKPVVAPSESSDTYILPAHSNKSVGISWDTGTPEIYFTFNGQTDILSGAAQWNAWDLTSVINSAVTGVYVTNSGLAAITLVIAARVA